MIAAAAAAVALKAEPRDARMLVASGRTIVAIAPDATRASLITDAEDGAYSPDGTFISFARGGDLWLANSDGSGQRRLTATPNVVEWGPSWSPDGTTVVYSARVAGRRQIRLVHLPTGPSQRVAASGFEEWSPAFSAGGRLAFVSSRTGSPAIFVARADGSGATPFDVTPPAVPPVDVRDLAWSPDGGRLAYTSAAEDGTTSIVVDDGAAQTALTVTAARDEHPVWSPAGTRIAYDDGSGRLRSVGADGSDQRELGEGTPLDWRVVPAGRPRYPNLVQRVPSGLLVTEGAHRHWLLGFTSMIDNRGPGVLWIRGLRHGAAHTMRVRQLVQIAGGATRVLPESGELHYTVAPPHYHWHLLGFDRYELRRAEDDALLVRDRKSGFCIADHYGLALGVPHGAPRFLSSCEQFHPDARFVDEGSSVGYTDRYLANFHGQNLDVTRVPPGRYWLVHRTNADFHLRESRYDDDAAALLVHIDWPGGRSATPRVTPMRACPRERC